MVLAHGGGIRTIEDAKEMLALGVEKIVVNTHAIENSSFVTQAANVFGSQSVVVCMDVRKTLFGKHEVFTRAGRQNGKMNPVECAKRMEEAGAGELVVNSIDRDGTMLGYDVDLIKSVTSAVNVPVIACGGAGVVEHFREAVKEGGASAVAAGSMFVFQGKHRAVLISYPEANDLNQLWGN